MKSPKLIEFLKSNLIDPISKNKINLNFDDNGNLILANDNNGNTYQLNDGVLNMTNVDNYANNFGHQWNKFNKTQLDSFSNTKISENRFKKATGWETSSLKNCIVLDVGCGVGRFSEIALNMGALVIAIDISSAAIVAKNNFGYHKNFISIQADIYNLPFKKNSFTHIYCLGVIQHTPNIKESFHSMCSLLRTDNSQIIVDFYWLRFRTIFSSKYFIRFFIKNLKQEQIYSFLKKYHSQLYFLSNILFKFPIFGKYLCRILPVVNYRGIYPLTEDQLLEWSFLDTYDNWAPKFDSPQTKKKINKYAIDNNLVDIEILEVGHLVLRGKKKY